MGVANDHELFDLIRDALTTAVVGDVLDQLGRTSQFLPAGIRPLAPQMIVVGRAMPVLVAPAVDHVSQPFGRLTEAVDGLRPGEVYVADGGGIDAAAWGELLTATARSKGAVGAVIDGYHRDTTRVLAQEWPVFSRGAYAQDSRVRSAVVEVRATVCIGRVAITPGDLVFGDVDGVVVVPAEVEAEVIERAVAKLATEADVRGEIDNGMTSSAAFDRYGVL